MKMASSQLPANGEQLPTTVTAPANALVSRGPEVDTTNTEGMKSKNSTFSANKRKRELVGGGNISDIGEKKLVGEDSVESAAGTEEVEMKDAEATEINEGIKEVEMQDATEVQEKIASKEDNDRQVNNDPHTRSNQNAAECNEKQVENVARDDEAIVDKDDYMRSNMNATEDHKQIQTTKLDKSECNENQSGSDVAHDDERKVNKDDYARLDTNASTEVCKQNQSTDKSECNEKQIGGGGGVCGDEGKVNKDDYTRSSMSASTEVCKQNQSTDKSECNEKQIRVGASGQQALGEVATLLKQVEDNSDEKAEVEVEVKVLKKTDTNGVSQENGNGNGITTRMSYP